MFGPDISKVETMLENAKITFFTKEEYHIASKTSQVYFCEYTDNDTKEKILSLIYKYKDNCPVIDIYAQFVYKISLCSFDAEYNIMNPCLLKQCNSSEDALKSFAATCIDVKCKSEAIVLSKCCFENTNGGSNQIGKEKTLKICFNKFRKVI